MGRKKKRVPYRIIGAYDSETCNCIGSSGIYAYPVSHQLGLLDCPIEDINAQNIEQHCNVRIYRHAFELYNVLDEIASKPRDYVPVICCHNLAFDMYGLSPYFEQCANVRVLAKSCRKPITFTIQDENNKPLLVLWDTLVFTQQSLARMGEDCGYTKATGEWDYELIRTPETPLTNLETDYARRDIYALLAWLGWWIKRNPDIDTDLLGASVVTKTGVVRERRRKRFYNRRKGKGSYSIGEYWRYLNVQEMPKDDDELFSMMAATRGGFTFCAYNHASKVYDLEDQPFSIVGFDATSMHPAQMVSHSIPISFTKTCAQALENVFHVIEKTSASYILKHWGKPFMFGVYACYELTGIRPKANSLYERNGILPLASARFETVKQELNENNQDNQRFRNENPCKDSAVNPVYAFGKLIKADSVKVWVTELAIWEIAQSYDYESVKAVSGYMSTRFVKPSDMGVVSVMQFYKAKNIYKRALHEFETTGHVNNVFDLRNCGIPDFICDGLHDGTLSMDDAKAAYMGLKADLNALFGIEASNEYRRDTVLTKAGIEYTGQDGICNAPRTPKTHYQYGQRIVGWSRIVQHIAMKLLEPYCIDIINGDTDSLKVCIQDDLIDDAVEALSYLGRAIDKGKAKITQRVKANYPDLYDPLEGIGWYVMEFQVKRFCASWNKAYCTYDNGFHFTIAGIPTGRGIRQLADKLYANGMSFGEICDIFLGYNTIYAYDLLHLHSRTFPEWGDILMRDVVDYQGNRAKVIEPAALALFPMAKTLNDTSKFEIMGNYSYAYRNRPTINDETILITSKGIER